MMLVTGINVMSLITPILIVLGIVLILAVVLSMWKKVPQDKAGVVTGMKKRVITGGGGLVIPVFERIDYISLGNIPLSVSTTNSLSSAGVPVSVVTTAVIKVSNNSESTLTAIEQFTGRNEVEIAKNIEETSTAVLEGKLREIIATMSVEDLYQKREEFSASVNEVVGLELKNMGLEVKNFTITDISDKNNYITSLGEGMIARRRRDAEIQKAEASRDTEIKTSEAKREGEAARLLAETQIAEAEKKKQVLKSAYMEEQSKAQAKAELAHEVQVNITQKEVIATQMDAELLKQQRQKEIVEAETQVKIVQAQKNTELAEQRALEKEKALLSEVVKPAEADRKRQEQESEANKFREIKQAEAEAEKKKIDALAEAEAIKAKALAESEAIKAKAVAESEAISKKGKAEAEAISAKLLAEAEGLDKKAEALTKMNDAGMMQMLFDVLPQFASAVAEPLKNIEKITIIDSGNGESGVSQVGSYVPTLLAKTIESVKETTGFNLVDVMKSGTIDAKTNKNIDIKGIDTVPVVPVSNDNPQNSNWEVPTFGENTGEVSAQEIIE